MTLCNVVPFVSVIVPVYNDPIGISNLLSFLAVQTYASDSFEVIVCDNGSSDNTKKVVIDVISSV